MDTATFLVQCLNAVQYGLLLFLVASGLTLIFGLMGVINLAHGSFYMIVAYTAYGLSSCVAPPAWLAGTIPLGDLMTYPVYRLFMSGVCLFVAAGLFALIARTRLGMA